MYAGYRERVWLNWWVWTVVVAVVSSTALLGRGNFGYAFERPPTAILYVFLLLDVIFIPIVLNFCKVEIQVNKESVRVGYGLLKKAIPVEEIVSCVPARTRLPLYGGVMLRLGENDLPNFKAGNAVKITGKAGKSFLIPTNKPEELSKIIKGTSKA
jgi:hypothetical protein